MASPPEVLTDWRGEISGCWPLAVVSARDKQDPHLTSPYPHACARMDKAGRLVMQAPRTARQGEQTCRWPAFLRRLAATAAQASGMTLFRAIAIIAHNRSLGGRVSWEQVGCHSKMMTGGAVQDNVIDWPCCARHHEAVGYFRRAGALGAGDKLKHLVSPPGSYCGHYLPMQRRIAPPRYGLVSAIPC
jgi:hypothetical protein